jgi:RHS repeat-associated protein
MSPHKKNLKSGALWLGRAIPAILLVATAQAWASVTVTLTAPAGGSIYTSWSNITLTADASAGQGFTLSKVEFFHGTSLIGTDFSAPYGVTWAGAPVGQHSLTAKATAIKKNNPDQTATSPAVNITVNAQLHYVHADHLNTPRLVADATGTTVWRWDQAEPFGANPVDEDPDANSVAFDLPLRLPGQRYDAETALHYNYFRDYDPSIGRYGESDLIGLKGGLNSYAYVHGSPISAFDPLGLKLVKIMEIEKRWIHIIPTHNLFGADTDRAPQDYSHQFYLSTQWGEVDDDCEFDRMTSSNFSNQGPCGWAFWKCRQQWLEVQLRLYYYKKKGCEQDCSYKHVRFDIKETHWPGADPDMSDLQGKGRTRTWSAR